MDYIAAIILGVIQGLTEFLPISSTAHLILTQKLLQVSPEKFGLTFDVALHIGTTVAVVFYFWQTWITLFIKSFKPGEANTQNVDRRLLIAILVGSIPAGLFGLLFADIIEQQFRSPLVIVVGLLFGSAIFYVAEKLDRQRRDMTNVSIPDGFLVGCAQAVALIPGISRSGITISAGLLRGFDRETAARFAFLLSTPVIVGAAVKKFTDVFLSENTSPDWALFVIGTFTALVTGYVTIVYFLRFLKTKTLVSFIWYRVILAIIVFVLYLTGIIK